MIALGILFLLVLAIAYGSRSATVLLVLAALADQSCIDYAQESDEEKSGEEDSESCNEY